jgi:UDP-N-acetylmuramate--alanine ligase
LVYIDDYAHHPEEIKAVQQAVRELYPGKFITVIFQPHLYSRTRDFADDFAKALSGFDSVILLDIYPARELPIAGITSQWLLDKIDHKNKALLTKTELLQSLKQNKAQVVLSLGAGDIGEEVYNIKQSLKYAG